MNWDGYEYEDTTPVHTGSYGGTAVKYAVHGHKIDAYSEGTETSVFIDGELYGTHTPAEWVALVVAEFRTGKVDRVRTELLEDLIMAVHKK